MSSKIKLNPTTKLERAVAKWLRSRGRDYDDGIEGAARDLFYGGCASGIVGGLIYYRDTLAFYKRHASEIDSMIKAFCDDTGSALSSLNGWDDSDPLARDTSNRNLLAWFGFEEAARKLCDEAGIEV